MLTEHCGTDYESTNPKLKISKVRLLLSKTRVTNFVPCIKVFFLMGQGNKTLERKTTHFALEIEFVDRTKLVLERMYREVSITNRKRFDDEHVSDTLHDFTPTSFEDVLQFYKEHSNFAYNCFTRNCKHTAYAFVRDVLLREDIGKFGSFCRRLEVVWANQQYLRGRYGENKLPPSVVDQQ